MPKIGTTGLEKNRQKKPIRVIEKTLGMAKSSFETGCRVLLTTPLYSLTCQFALKYSFGFLVGKKKVSHFYNRCKTISATSKRVQINKKKQPFKISDTSWCIPAVQSLRLSVIYWFVKSPLKTHSNGHELPSMTACHNGLAFYCQWTVPAKGLLYSASYH